MLLTRQQQMAIAGSPVPLDPMALGGRLFEYWDANTPATLNLTGALVNNWASRKTAVLAPAQATSGFKPVYTAPAGTQRGFVTYDGTDDFLGIDAMGNLPANAAVGEIIVQARFDGSTGLGTRRLITFGGSGTTSRYSGVTNATLSQGATSVGAGNVTLNDPTATPLVGFGDFVSRTRFTATNLEQQLNEYLMATLAQLTAAGTLRVRLGASNAGVAAGFLPGRLYRVAVTDLLTDAEYAGILAYMRAN